MNKFAWRVFLLFTAAYVLGLSLIVVGMVIQNIFLLLAAGFITLASALLGLMIMATSASRETKQVHHVAVNVYKEKP